MKLGTAVIFAGLAAGLVVAACVKSDARLQITVDGNGVTDPPAGTYLYAAGTTVKVTARPANGATFAGWRGAQSGAGNPVTVVVEGEEALEARFAVATSSGGTTSGGTSSGGASSGGTSSGATSSGGTSSGGTSSGGTSSGGTSSGGASGGGTSSGGTSSGGASGGGTSSGGASGGGTSSGGTSSGGTSSGGTVTAAGPCDLYAEGNTPCVAAHSTVRALYGDYSGKLYQVRRSDGTTKDIGVVAPGGAADAAAQDAFCRGTTCVTTILYDQSGKGNHLEYQGPGSTCGGKDDPAVATTERLTVGGRSVYSLYVKPGNSYWRNGSRSGIPTGAAPEGMYMVTSGTHVNGGCCFDYGNSETTRKADGQGAMDAIYFGTSCWFGGCSGAGPWVQADLEWGLYPGGSQAWNPNQRAFGHRYVTAMLKNDGTSRFAIKGANAQSGNLTTLWDGALPRGYSPMRKQGAIVLGSGGDCCADGRNQSEGTFYEGAIVSGFPSDETDARIQANVVAAGYGG